MANTYVLISSYTVGAGGIASVSFSSIPSTYTDLVVKLSARSSAGGIGSNATVQFNGVTTGYTYKLLEGDGSSAASYSGSTGLNALANGNSSTANTFGNSEIYIPNYTSNNNKSYSTDSTAENSGTTGVLDLFGALWSNTATISSISLTPASGSYVQYSNFYLYGIKNS